MANTKHYNEVDENVTPVKSMSFVTDFRRAKISSIIYLCSVGSSCVTVKIIKIKNPTTKA